MATTPEDLCAECDHQRWEHFRGGACEHYCERGELADSDDEGMCDCVRFVEDASDEKTQGDA